MTQILLHSVVHPKSGLIENSISLIDANTSMGHGSKTDESCRCSPSEQTAGIVRAKETIVLWCRQKSPPPPSTITSRLLRCAVCLGALSGRIFFRTTVFVRSVREDHMHADYMISCEEVMIALRVFRKKTTDVMHTKNAFFPEK